MRPIVFTRPVVHYPNPALQPQTHPSAAVLQAMGHMVMELPTLELTPHIEPLACQHVIEHWQDYQGIVFVSQNAAHFAHAQMRTLNLTPSSNQWLGTVGQSSLHTLQHLWPTHPSFISPATNHSQDSQGLWQAINASEQLKTNQPILLVRAQNGRNELIHTLSQAAIDCDIWPCYQRIPYALSPQHIADFTQACQQQALIVVSSIQSLQALLHNFESSHPQPWLQCRLITIHPRITAYAQSIGFSRVLTTEPHTLTQALVQAATGID